MQRLQEVHAIVRCEPRYTCKSFNQVNVFSLFEFPISMETQVSNPAVSHIGGASLQAVPSDARRDPATFVVYSQPVEQRSSRQR